MDLLIRNKWVSLRGSSVVKDLNEKDVMRVQGKFWTFTAKKFIQTMDKETKYVVRNKFWRLFAYRAFIFDEKNERVAHIRRKIFSFHDRFFIDSKFGNIEIKGNIFCFDYHIFVNGKEVGHLGRRISLRDSFVLHVEEDDIDPYFLVALVIAIDNITDRRQQNYSD
jgi:uncharacterized protein YxjI